MSASILLCHTSDTLWAIFAGHMYCVLKVMSTVLYLMMEKAREVSKL